MLVAPPCDDNINKCDNLILNGKLFYVYQQQQQKTIVTYYTFLLSLSVLSHVFGEVDKTSSNFSVHSKIGNFFIVIALMLLPEDSIFIIYKVFLNS